MGPNRILVDSNSYFRLALFIHPLLNVEFGKPRYCLGVISELDLEYNKNPILKSKFNWVNEARYSINRKGCFPISASTHKSIYLNYGFIRETAKYSSNSASDVDILALSYGVELRIPIVTDDIDMGTLGIEYGVKMYSSLEIMHLMATCQHITMEMAGDIVRSWIRKADTPSKFRAECERLFGKTFVKLQIPL